MSWCLSGVGTSILWHGREVRSDDPHFGDFQSNWVTIVYLNTIWHTINEVNYVSLNQS